MEGSSVNGVKCYTATQGEFISVSSACYLPPLYEDGLYEYGDKQYCILHLPSDDKAKNFAKALGSKLNRKDFNFTQAYFPMGDFRGVDFSRWVDFSGATFSRWVDFSGVTFSEEVVFHSAIFREEANFSGATFSKEANFSGATFSKRATLHGAIFSDRVQFLGATFSKDASFSGVTFSKDASFSEVTFTGWTYFSGATFKESAQFSSLQAFPSTALLFRNANIEKPERISFSATFSRPSWFVDVVDAQRFDFSDVEWFRIPDASEPNTDQLKPLTLEKEIEHLIAVVEEEREVHSLIVRGSPRTQPQGSPRMRSLRMLTNTCRKLMNNAEENRDYPAANKFHYWSMEAQRLEGWSRLGLIATLYWALSGYGEKPLRAFGVLVALYAAFAVTYMLLPASPFSLLASSAICQHLECIGQAATYSLGALARLVPAEPKLSPGWFQFLVTVEGILGPLQVALFLLAVRRKVMR